MDLEHLEKRLEAIDQRLNELVARAEQRLTGEPKRRPRVSGRSDVFLGIVLLLVGLLWLGQSLNIAWIENVKIWPLFIIAFGLYLLFGGRS